MRSRLAVALAGALVLGAPAARGAAPWRAFARLGLSGARAPERPRVPPRTARLVDYARSYAVHQQHYNGNRPEETLARVIVNGVRWNLRGQVSFWDVDPARVPVELVGQTRGTPFLTPEGKVRIFNHYMDRDRQLGLFFRLGRPSGRIEAEMTSSFRTLVLYPEGGVPFMLKFSGDWLDRGKRLEAREVRLSVARSRALAGNPNLVPEPAGLIVEGRAWPGVRVLYRPMPLPAGGRLAPGDELLSAHVLNDPRFAASPLGARLFAARGGADAWVREELAPKLARAIYRAIARSFAHLELHAQNIDVLVAGDGKVREVFVKDLLDVMHDPALESASGHRPRATRSLRDLSWGHIGEPSATYETSGFYFAFLGQTTFPAAGRHGASALHEALRVELLALALARLRSPSVRAHPDYARLFTPDLPLHETIATLRELLVKSGLSTRFRADPTTRAHLLDAAAGTPLHGPGRATPDASWEFGRAGDVPVAVRRDAHGQVLDYFFRFE